MHGIRHVMQVIVTFGLKEKLTILKRKVKMMLTGGHTLRTIQLLEVLIMYKLM